MHTNRIFILLTLLFFSCEKNETASTAETTALLYGIYAERSDFEKFLSFYDEDMVLEDFIFGERIEGKESFKAFF